MASSGDRLLYVNYDVTNPSTMASSGDRLLYVNSISLLEVTHQDCRGIFAQLPEYSIVYAQRVPGVQWRAIFALEEGFHEDG